MTNKIKSDSFILSTEYNCGNDELRSLQEFNRIRFMKLIQNYSICIPCQCQSSNNQYYNIDRLDDSLFNKSLISRLYSSHYELGQPMLNISNSSNSTATSSGNNQSSLKLSSKVISLIVPNCCGQVFGSRSSYHKMNIKRSFTDTQLWTHSFFLLPLFTSLYYRFYDMTLLLAVTIPLSYSYHYSYEKPGRLAQAEGIFAKCLFIYGIIQIFQIPSVTICIFEVLCLLITVAVFAGTNFHSNYYEQFHPLMHIVPSFWGLSIIYFHTPLFLSFL